MLINHLGAVAFPPNRRSTVCVQTVCATMDPTDLWYKAPANVVQGRLYHGMDANMWWVSPMGVAAQAEALLVGLLHSMAFTKQVLA